MFMLQKYDISAKTQNFKVFSIYVTIFPTHRKMTWFYYNTSHLPKDKIMCPLFFPKFEQDMSHALLKLFFVVNPRSFFCFFNNLSTPVSKYCCGSYKKIAIFAPRLK